jgi:hypothetical protein
VTVFLHTVMPTKVGIHNFRTVSKVVDADLRWHDAEIFGDARE